MYNITPTLKNTYSEISQVNPLRWEILYRENKTNFTSQSGKIKCKDFFNELTRKYCSGQDSSIYRFSTAAINLNDEGVYLRLHNIEDMAVFESNLDKTINTGLDCDFHVISESLNNHTCLLFIPVYYFTNTYLTSLVTYVIRVCNSTTEMVDFTQAITDSTDVAFDQSAKDLAIKWKFDIPEKYQEYWYYCGDKYNSKTHDTPDSVSVVHNNGVQSWSQWVKE